MLVIINDETTGRRIQLDLSTTQYERAQRDAEYVNQLITEFNEQNNVPDPPNINLNEENEVLVPLRNIEDNADPLRNIEENDDNSQSTSNLYIWSDTCILLLLSLYEENKEQFGSRRHKKIFDDIAKKMHDINPAYTMTGGQCQSKINSLKKTYKKIIDHNSTSGNDRVTWPYFDRMNEIFGQTGWANPVATASEAGPAEARLEPTQNKKKIKTDTILADYFESKKKNMTERLELRKESIKLRQEQHKEKMEMLRTMCNLLNNK